MLQAVTVCTTCLTFMTIEWKERFLWKPPLGFIHNKKAIEFSVSWDLNSWYHFVGTIGFEYIYGYVVCCRWIFIAYFLFLHYRYFLFVYDSIRRILDYPFNIFLNDRLLDNCAEPDCRISKHFTYLSIFRQLGWPWINLSFK